MGIPKDVNLQDTKGVSPSFLFTLFLFFFFFQLLAVICATVPLAGGTRRVNNSWQSPKDNMS